MVAAAKKMDFMEAARLRDEMLKMQAQLEQKEKELTE
jgi:excinuclease UvrABC helicase subunit UvrB